MTRAAAASMLLALVVSARGDRFPFVMPWDDATPSITDLSSWNDKPAGKHGFVTITDGHLFAGPERLKIFGVNVCFGANFPAKAEAPKIASRLAKIGVNCVRFHHMDGQRAPNGLFAKDGVNFDPERLDRLDFFIARLKEHGIYSDLNLHVSRTYPDRPQSEKEGNPKYDKGVDNFSAEMVKMQKEFARALLTHRNPYTGTTYAEEPAVAFVEINNENALLQEWHTGGLDGIAPPYRRELGARWTRFLESRHGSEERIRAIFSEGAREPGVELLANGDFAHGGRSWVVEQHDGTVCTAEFGDRHVRLVVSGEAKEAWHAQLTQPRLTVVAGDSYRVRFEGKASATGSIRVVLSQAHEPWQVLDSREVTLTPDVTEHVVQLRAPISETNARLALSGLARTDPVTFEFQGVSFRRAGIEGGLERDAAGQFQLFSRADFDSRTPVAQDEWMRFLWSIEENYWPGMRRFLREELGVRALVVGTQLGWSPFPLQQTMDVIDSHAYWQHPRFPGKEWDPENWTVRNLPMAGDPQGGTLPGLALQRVAGKPYLCTEYNHAAPNRFRAEAFPLLCAYAALQDWDGVFAFAYSHRLDAWDQRHISGFFDIDQDPARLVPLAGAVAMFRRGDVRAALGESFAGIALEDAIARVRITGPRLGAELFGVKWAEALIRRVGVRLTDGETYAASPAPAGPIYTSDTNELVWDASVGVATVNTPRSKAVIGKGNGRRFGLGEVTIEPESDWACIQATVIEGDSFAAAHRVLVAATAAVESTGMRWKDDSRTSVGREWGKAPTLAEGVRGRIHLPSSKAWSAWALDGRGERIREIAMQAGTLELAPEHQTLWYEVRSK